MFVVLHFPLFTCSHPGLTSRSVEPRMKKFLLVIKQDAVPIYPTRQISTEKLQLLALFLRPIFRSYLSCSCPSCLTAHSGHILPLYFKVNYDEDNKAAASSGFEGARLRVTAILMATMRRVRSD
eukprot:scaffold36921_cov50-Cyclotella_meneghiniana.AAC.1